jgi:N-acetylglutamate synthase-like GNAT family acetyltransferase
MDIRNVRESDIDGLVGLFRSAYGDDYAIRDVYDGDALKRAIYSDNIYWLVAEEAGEILGCGALVMGMGDDNDQIGEIGRLVVAPGLRSKGLARRMVDALVAATGERVEFAFGETRTVHPFSQKMGDATGMPPLGFMPMAYQMQTRESFVFNGQLFGNGRALRTPGAARVIPEVEPLARLSLRNLGLEEPVHVADRARGYAASTRLAMRPLDGGALLRLLRIEQGRVVEPEVFGPIHVDQGLSQVLAREMRYFVACEGPHAIGGAGYAFEERDRSLRITELIGADPGAKGALLQFVVDRAEDAHDVRLVQCDASAESPAMQQTLLELGFLPAGYMPGMVFHATRRIDVVRFIKLFGAWEPGPLALVESSQAYFDLVGPACERALADRAGTGAWREAWRNGGFGPSELDILRHWTTERSIDRGATLEATCCYIVLSGEIDAGGARHGVAACVNGGALLGRAPPQPPVAAAPTRVLALDGAGFAEFSQRHPQLALKLLGQSLH